MIFGAHSILYARNADEVRAFFRDVLGLTHVDAGHGWLIFALPPAELAVHPAEEDELRCELYLMCDDIEKTIEELRQKNVECGEVLDRGWGRLTTVNIPGGGRLGMYEPRHPTAIPRRRNE